MSNHSDTAISGSQAERQLHEEPAPFSAPAPNQNGGPASKDSNAAALDDHADEARRQQAGQFNREDKSGDPNESPDLTRYPGDHFEDGT